MVTQQCRINSAIADGRVFKIALAVPETVYNRLYFNVKVKIKFVDFLSPILYI
jgi:hypothetical protein